MNRGADDQMKSLALGHPEHYDAPWLMGAHKRVRALLARLPWQASEFLIFGFKQAWACLFGGAMLALIITTKLIWNPSWPIHRYDALLFAAIAIQGLFLALKLETWKEAQVIAIFHVVGTAMEIFKTGVGSWAYPEAAFFRIGGVPLFTGFMYACVGSYIARVMRIFDMRFARHPPRWQVWLLALGIYVNFFAHHYLPDARLFLFAFAFLIWFRTRIDFAVDIRTYWMPLLVAAFLVSFFIWIAENIGTLTGTWAYPGVGGWRPVSLQKIGAWYLLIMVSFALVIIVHPPKPPNEEAPAPQK
ncbi:DUF817 domain-containing protein [Terrarubrum flagellatum]|uniref:DUF817 domain-containing protein n=1 Tax=Terrirubrum flagellatum TaxID=2895980 RepID=UPI0031455740